MNLTAAHAFDYAVIHQYMYENAAFDVFLTGTPLFRRTDPIQTFATIDFSPFHTAFPTVTPLHAYLPERRQNATCHHTGYTGTGRYLGSPSSARRIPASRVFPAPASAGLIHFREQHSSFAVSQKPGVTHHFKMPRRNVADVASDHLFLTQRLAFMLPRAVIEVVMNHRAAAIVSQAGSRHRRPLQVPAQILHAVPGSPGLLRKMHLPVPAVLCLQVAPPLALVADLAQTRQHAGHDSIVAAGQQADNGVPPDGLHGLFFKEEAAPPRVTERCMCGC